MVGFFGGSAGLQNNIKTATFYEPKIEIVKTNLREYIIYDGKYSKSTE